MLHHPHIWSVKSHGLTVSLSFIDGKLYKVWLDHSQTYADLYLHANMLKCFIMVELLITGKPCLMREPDKRLTLSPHLRRSAIMSLCQVLLALA